MGMSIGEQFSRYGRACCDWFHCYFIFSPGALFSFGLVISHNLVEYACVSFLVTFYTTEEQNKKHLAEAAMLVCFQEGFASLFSLFLAHISDAHIGRFNATLFSIGAYVTGLTLFWSHAQCSCNSKAMDIPLFLLANLLVSLGKGGRDPVLQSFLCDQLFRENLERKQREVSINVWLRSGWVIGAAIAIFGFLGATWDQVFKKALMAMAASGLWFCVGFFWYKSIAPKGSHISPILKVLKVALSKFRCKYPDSPAKFYWNNSLPKNFHNINYSDKSNSNQIMLLPRVPFIFKWVDKAAVIEESSSSPPPQLQESMGNLCSVRQVIQVKSLLMFTYIGSP